MSAVIDCKVADDLRELLACEAWASFRSKQTQGSRTDGIAPDIASEGRVCSAVSVNLLMNAATLRVVFNCAASPLGA